MPTGRQDDAGAGRARGAGSAGRPGGAKGEVGGGGTDWRRLHLWQIQPIRDVLVIAAVFGLLWLGYALRLVTVPLLVALLLAYLFEPLVSLAVRRISWMTRKIAAGAIIAAVLVFIVVPAVIGILYGGQQALRFAGTLADNTINLTTYVVNAPAAPPSADGGGGDGGGEGGGGDAAPSGARGSRTDAEASPAEPDGQQQVSPAERQRRAERAYAALSDDTWRRLADFVVENRQDDLFETGILWARENSGKIGRLTIATGTGLLSRIGHSLASFALFGFQAFLTTFFFFFICVGYGGVLAFFKELIPEHRRDRVVDLVGQFDTVVSGFVRGRLTICLAQCVFYSIGYLIVGVPAAVLVGIGVGILAIVPYLGLVGIPVSILLILLDPPTGFRSSMWWMLLAPIVVYQLGQLLDDYVLTPLIQGKSTNMDTPTVLFASIAGGSLAGVYGLLLGIPVAACIKIALKEVLWPKFQDWSEGRAKDPLPLGGGETDEDEGGE